MALLLDKINSNLKEFLKAGKSFEAGVLRLVISAIKNKEIEKKGKGLDASLSDEEIIEVLSKEAKKRKEAIDVYSKGGRPELAQKENDELMLIKNYLPEELSREEIEKVVEAAIKNTGATGQKEFGKVMGEAMKELKGKADTSTVSGVIKSKLGLE